MIPIVKENIDAIINVCKTHHLKSLYLFGSAALENDFTKKSFRRCERSEAISWYSFNKVKIVS